MQEEILRKILEKLVSIDEKLENISTKLNKPLPVVIPKPEENKPEDNIQRTVFTAKK